MPIEITAVAPDFILNKLQNSADITALSPRGYWNRQIPQVNTAAERDLVYPCLYIGPPVWEKNRKGNGPIHIGSRGFYEVSAVGLLYQIRKLEQFAALIPGLLFGKSGNAPNGGYVNSLDWIRPVDFQQTVGDQTYLRVGGVYMVTVRTSNS